jgi:hypothetical protein
MGGGRGALSVSQYGRLLYTEAIARDLYPLTRFQDLTTPPRQHQGHLTISLLVSFLKGLASRFPVEAIYNRFDESYCFTCRLASYLNIPVYSFVA